jgi:hypothetical protein
VKVFTKISLKVAATLCMAAVAFCVGFIVTGALYERWVVPDLVRKYPHDGQIGLATFVNASYGACICAIAVLVVGIIWTVKTSKRSTAI